MPIGYQQFSDQWGERAQLARDAIAMKPTRGIGSWMLHTMDAEFIEQYVDLAPGAFSKDPDGVYCRFQNKVGTCYIDQYLASNVLSMGEHGYSDQTERTATTGVEKIVLDGMEIDSPEAVLAHMEKFVFPARQKEIERWRTAPPTLDEAVSTEIAIQKLLGTNILHGPYSRFFSLPSLQYSRYGYVNYFMAYALYPEVMARDFAQQADLAVLKNSLYAQAIVSADLPRLLRLDHDMADSRGTLVDIRSLEAIWFPHLARAIEPLLKAGIRLIWHCDGNLMAMLPRLIECGIGGFQGFQYEDGMDYERICDMKTREGDDLFIIAGVSVTRTLPFGTRQDVIDQLKWLVAHGPKRGLLLGASSSIAPNTNRDNILAFIEGLAHYRLHGRD